MGRRPRYPRRLRDTESFFTVDLADLAPRGVIDVGKTHRMTWQRIDRENVRHPHGYVSSQNVTTWVSARLTRTADDQLRVLISSKQGGTGGKLLRRPVTLTLRRRQNAIGANRLWFCCPDCAKSVRVLYWQGWLRCRRCCGLKHTSELLFKTRRMERRAQDVLQELGGPGDHWAPLPDRPRYMHWKRYRRLADEYVSLIRPLRARDNRREAFARASLWRKVHALQRMGLLAGLTD